nr:CocE/NonD family hydrolase [Candidatus Freyarchaeota archaeon]
MEKNTWDIKYPRETPPGVVLEKNHYATMRDGIKIAMDVYKPATGDGPWPVILSIAPYKKEVLHEVGNIGFYVPKGYVIVNAQARGSGLSQGKYNFGDRLEQQDGYDLVEWIAQQPWCDGNVGMLGCSYLAMSQWYTALQKPPHLKCIVPYNGMTDTYRNSIYPGGVFNSGFMHMWGIMTLKSCIWPNPVPGKEQPGDGLGAWYFSPEDGPYYWERCVDRRVDELEIPTFSIIAAHVYIHTTSQLNTWPKIKAPKKLMVVPEVPLPYMLFFDLNLGVNQQILRWFDYWLKGIDTGIMDDPPVLIGDSGTGKWRYENEYPLKRTRWTKYYLRQNPAGPATEAPWGLLTPEPPKGNEAPDKLKPSPLSSIMPFMLNLQRLPAGSGLGIDPNLLNMLNPKQEILAYASPPLTEDLTVWGPLSITLYGSTDTDDTSTWAWFVKVGEVAPDGKVRVRTLGNLKASFRKVDETKSKPGQPWHSFQNPVTLKPNTIYDFQIEIQPLFLTFKAGHKIWVQITGMDPTYENDSTIDPVALMGGVSTKISVYHDLKHQSHLLLPVIPDAPEIQPVGPPVSDIYWGGPMIKGGLLPL